jgi:hypothetical protein
MWERIKQALRALWVYLVLVISALALFFMALDLRTDRLVVFVAAGVVFGCLIVLFLMARQRPVAVAKRPEVKTTLLSPTVLVSEARAAALVTYGQIGTVSVRKERAKTDWQAFDRFFGEELEMEVGVRVVAGVNLKQLREEDVRVEGKHVTVTLPPTKVFMVYVDEALTRVIAHRNGWFTGQDLSMLDAARREAMESMVNAAIDKDLFEKAGTQAATAVAAIARGLGFDDIQVIPTLPARGQHFEELQDPSTIARITSSTQVAHARDDQWSDG